jgi:hypothetical protein
MANKLSTGDIAIGEAGSKAREIQWKEISKRVAIERLDDYGSESIAAKFVAAFMEGAEWQRNNPIE